MRDESTILIVDDTETNIDILLELLDDKYDILVALSGESALEIVESEKIDLILLDIMMPNMDGYEVCQKLKAQERFREIPVVFITAKTDEDSIERAYEVGGIDYITKPFKPRELLARVKNQLKLKEVMRHLEFMASYDEMTGIYNRRKFFALSLERFAKSKKDLCAVMIDIDKFKNINDAYGHATGDKVIKLVTKTIRENLLNDAIFGRIGGEEFAAVCYSASAEKIINNIESLREKIENLQVQADDGSVVKFTISEGIAKAQEDTKTLDDLLKEADIALYEAKGKGRNRVIFR